MPQHGPLRHDIHTRLAHCGNHVSERHWRLNLNLQAAETLVIQTEGTFKPKLGRPGWHRIPPQTYKRNAAHRGANLFKGRQKMLTHLGTTPPVVTHVSDIKSLGR